MTTTWRVEATVGGILFFLVGIAAFAWGLCTEIWAKIPSGFLVKQPQVLIGRRPSRETNEILSEAEEIIAVGELLALFGLFLITFGLFFKEKPQPCHKIS